MYRPDQYRWLVIVVLLLLLFCGVGQTAEAQVTLKVGGADSQLLFRHSYIGKHKGLFADLLEDIAAKEQWQLQYVPCRWSDCLDKLNSGEIDLVMPVAYSAKRDLQLDFNRITVFNSWGQIFTTRSGAGSDISSLLDLNGVRIAVAKGSIYLDELVHRLNRFGVKPVFVELDSYSDVMTSLENQEVEAGVAPNLFASRYDDLYDVRPTSIVFSPTDLRFAVKHGQHAEVLDAIDRQLAQQLKDRNSAYHLALQRLYKQTQNPALPLWLKAVLFSVFLLILLFLAHLVFMRRLVDARTAKLEHEMEVREESQRVLQQRNHELYVVGQTLQQKLEENSSVMSALIKSKYQYKQLVTHAPFGILQTELNGRVRAVNPEMARMFGFDSAEEMIRLVADISELYCFPEQRLELIEKTLKSEGYVQFDEICCYHRNSSTITISADMRAVRGQDGHAIYLEGFFEDVTEQKRAERALRESEEMFRLYVQNLPLASLMVDSDCTVLRWNRAAEMIFGYAESEVTGLPLQELIIEKKLHPHFLELWERVQSGAHKGSEEYENITRDGRKILCEWSNTRFLDSQGDVLGIILIAQDITAKRHAEEMMVQTEKMMMIGGLAAGMAHEINNPMGIIVQNVQNIQRRLNSGLPANHRVAEEVGVRLEQVQQYLDKREIMDFIAKIGKAGQRTAKIIANMLQFSRKSIPGRQPANLAELLDQALELVSRDFDLKKHQNFSEIVTVKAYDPVMPLVPVNVVEFEQVIINLLKNAAQAVAGNCHSRTPEIRLGLSVEEEWAVIRVSDNGPGIPENVLKRIFEPFYTTKDVGSGTGLGLYVTYILITQHAMGSIEVDSVAGEGACFTVRLPLN